MKYLIYLRVSTDKQRVEMQYKMIITYLNCKHRDQVYDCEVFSDPDTSTRLPMEKRKGLQSMLECVKKGDIVLVYKLDRLSRDVIEMVSIYRLITREHGASVHSLNDPYCDDFSVGLMGILAEKEREGISIKTKDALKNKKNKNERYSGHLPYGFGLHETHLVPIRVGDEIVYKRGILIPENKEQRALALMKQLHLEGNSYQEIVKTLTDLGYLNREGKPFHKMTVYRILNRIKNSKYLDKLQEETESLAFHQ